MSGTLERLLAGRLLAGRYEVGEVVGSGGMSVVFRATDRTLGRPVAVKVVAFAAEGEEARARVRERFRREAAAAARVARHPNVAQVFDYGTDEALDLDFIVMELLRGRDLKQALRAGPLAPHEAAHVLRDAAAAIAAGHREGILHRDVKPANVFLVEPEGGPPSVRILDFGIAKPLGADPDDSLTTDGQIPHSPAYASPEQLRDDADLTPASDVYQLGLLGYEMLAGRRPFGEDERLRIRAGEEVPLPDADGWRAAPEPLRAAISRALHARPEQRFPDAETLVAALGSAADVPHDDSATALAPDGDATAVMPPPAVPLAPGVPVAVPAPAAPEQPRTEAGSASRPRGRPGAVWWVPALAVLAAVALWAAVRGGGDGAAAVADGEAPITAEGDLPELDEVFLRLEGEAAERAAEAAEEEGGGGADTDAEAASIDEAAAERIALEVQDALLASIAGLAEGDADRHAALYAETVDYLGRRVPRATLRDDAAALVRTYPEREITVLRQAIEVPGAARARVLVDREWRYGGGRERWEGADRRELQMERRDRRWLVVREAEVEVYRSVRSRG